MNDRSRRTLRRVATALPAFGVAVLVTATPSAFAADAHAASTATTATTTATAQRTAHQPDPTAAPSSGTATDPAAGHDTSGTAGTSGDVSDPQPLSNADQNSGGANGQCPGGSYCSTRSGLPSYNGSGTGAAVGKPCAGCVGRADNKNPAGQFPNGSDANNGYECDGNHGIGQTNPAHTGCTTSGGGGCPPTENCGGGGGCPPTEDCGGGTTGGAGGHVCAGHLEHGTCVLGERRHRQGGGGSTAPATLAERTVRTPAGAVLPFTGIAGLGVLVGAAAALTVLGSGLVLLGRRRAATGSA